MARLLVVDDEVFIRKLYQAEFEREGYAVTTASDPAEALQLMKSVKPELVILDIELDQSNGLDLLNRLRQEDRRCAVILNTAYSTYKSDFQTWLADAYIMKSSDLTQLKNKVKQLLMEKTCGSK